mgnify:CR=1 FL=1|tara:strand:- start:211 stop:414 length:204 start_codon:yes stop_codon:yes gene_type:complete
MIVSVLLKALGTIVMRLFAAMATEKLLEWFLFKAGEVVVKSTETPHDDEFLQQLKESYYERKSKGGN